MYTEPTIPMRFDRFPLLTADQKGSVVQYQRAFPCCNSFVLSKNLQKHLIQRLNLALYCYDSKTKTVGKRIQANLIYPKRVRWTTDFAYYTDHKRERRIVYGHFKLHGQKIYVGARPTEILPSKVRDSLTAKTRWAVLTRDKFACVACGATPKDGAKLHVDHVVPVSRGGTNEMENLRVLCQMCNAGRGNQYENAFDLLC